MASYEKLTLDRFKQSLKDNKYVNLTGARRAIGKTTSWTVKEKEAAQDIALKHFGGTEPKQAAKAATKKALKVTKKSVTKAQAQAVLPKKQPKKKGPQRRPVTSNEDVVGYASDTHGSTAQAGTINEHRLAASDTIALATATRQEFENLKRLNPALDIVAATKQLYNILSNAMGHMNQTISGLPHPGSSSLAAPRIELPENGSGQNDVQVIARANETVGDVEENGIHDSELTEAERKVKEIFLQTAPASSIAGLPRPA